MALQDIILRRLAKALETIAEQPVDIRNDPTLGELGFDASSLRQILAELNGNKVGFADLLDRPLTQNDLRTSTKLRQLAATILTKSMVQNEAEYELKISERIRLGLRKVIARIAGIPEQEIIPSENIEQFLTLTDENVERLLHDLTEEFEKYLFSSITRSDIEGTIGRVQRRLTNRMML